ncbi:AIPR family protein [Mucilaginibacter sp. 3215]|uniref:AIPR family protein n=1 Tax=Mucilaginibacter sp. 3215 TaxID=3373912 RepID=UPI003D25E21F
MANLNDFKLLDLKCKKYFDLLEKDLGKKLTLPSERHKERFGFYLLMLESICDLKDISDITDIITDQEFNSLVFNKKDDDFGVDAIYVNMDENYIDLFNFKYREKFNNKKQGLNETFLSLKLANSILTENTKGMSGKVKQAVENVIECLSSNEIWKLRLHVVSNDNEELDVNGPELSQLNELYGLEIVTYGLDKIANLMSIRPKPVNAILHLDKDAILPFVESSLSSSKSYVVRVSASDLVRITCNNEHHRENYKMENFQELAGSNMDFDLLFDNVRGLIVRSKYNDNIFRTLKEEPTKFFMYNNGLTITANDIISEDTNANKKVKINIKDFQVVNGGQTLRTIHKFSQLDKDNITKYLSNCELLLRIFKTSSANNIRNKIAEYTNSQNAISNVDLKSLSEEQIQIEQFLDQNNIIYARKVGDTGIADKGAYVHKISMEKFGQILFAIQGFPEKASNQKKQIFDKYYDQIFNKGNFEITRSADYVKRYYEIKYAYEAHGQGYPVTDQKIFYIIYLDQKLATTLDQKIDLFETTLKAYDPDNGKIISEARKLIQVKFKEQLDEKVTAILA